MTWRRAPVAGLCAAACFGSIAAPAARAQDADATIRLDRIEQSLREHDRDLRAAAAAGQTISERLLFDAGVVARLAFYSIEDSEGEAHNLRQYEANLFLRLEFDGGHRFFGRLRFQYDDWESGDSFDDDGDGLNNPVLDRIWYEFDLRGLREARGEASPDFNLHFKGGRQYLVWNSGLVLSASIDAAVLDVEMGDFLLTGIAGKTSPFDTVDFDGSRPGFDNRTDRVFYGGQLSLNLQNHTPFVYVLRQKDHNKDDFTIFADLFPTRFDYDSTYFGIGSRGALSPSLAYHAEAVYETGETLSNSFTEAGLPFRQTRDDISAWAAIAGLTYLVRDTNDTRFDFEAIIGSGDDDRLDASNTFGGNEPGTTDKAFNALGYVNTGLALAPSPSNLLSLRAGASTSLFISPVTGRGDVRVGVDGFLFNKLDSDAPLNVPTTDDTFVGGEIDLFLDWRIASDLFFTARYGVFFGGEAIPDDQDETRHFLYLGLSYAF